TGYITSTMNIPPPRAVFDPLAARLERELKHTRALVGCRFDPSGRFLFVSAEDDTVQRFDLLAGTQTALVGHESWVRGIAFVSPTPPARVDFDAWTKQRDARQAAIGFPGALGSPPKTAPFIVVTADYRGNLIWWQGDAETPKPLKTVQAHEGFAR